MLIDAAPDARPSPLVVFLTNDLTDKVVAEAVAAHASVIVSYHPTPFGGMKKFSREDRAGRVVLACAAERMAVYSPHTALDSVPGGINDWLATGVLDVPFNADDFVSAYRGSSAVAPAAHLASIRAVTPAKDVSVVYTGDPTRLGAHTAHAHTHPNT